MKQIALLLFLIPFSCIRTSNFDAGYLAQKIDSELTIPFSFDSELIIIEASINGVNGRFLFDNGFSLSALNEDFAQRAKVTMKGSASIRDGNNNRTNLKRATIQNLKITEAAFINTGAYIIDTNRFLPCDPIDGIIGASIINKINWSINFDKQVLSLSSNAFQSDGFEIPISIAQNNSSFANFSISNINVRTKLDLGYQGQLKLKKEKFLRSFEHSLARKNIGITSLSASGLGNIDTTYAIDNQPVSSNNQQLHQAIEAELTNHLKYDARMGLGYLKNYNVVINSSGKRYVLKERNTEDAARVDKSYGVAIYPINGIYRIINIDSNRPDLRAFSLMDTVLQIDDKVMSTFSDKCEFSSYLNSKKVLSEDIVLIIEGLQNPVALSFIEPVLSKVSESE